MRQFENLLISLREFDPVVKRDLLLAYVGDTTKDIFDVLPDTGSKYESAIASLNQYFDPIRNKDMVIFEFRETQQESNETLRKEFYRRIKTKVADWARLS